MQDVCLYIGMLVIASPQLSTLDRPSSPFPEIFSIKPKKFSQSARSPEKDWDPAGHVALKKTSAPRADPPRHGSLTACMQKISLIVIRFLLATRYHIRARVRNVLSYLRASPQTSLEWCATCNMLCYRTEGNNAVVIVGPERTSPTNGVARQSRCRCP